MKHNSDVPVQLALFSIAPTFEKSTTIHDPYWDEVETAPQQVEDNRWNPSDFGEVPRLVTDNGQLTIFFDDSDEPPDPDDYKNLDDYHQAWADWRTRVGGQTSEMESQCKSVGEQVTSNTLNTVVTSKTGVRFDTHKSAPQHDTHWIERYWVERSGNKYWYFRYCWMTGRKIHRIYLGSVTSILAKRKKADVEVWISDGKLPIEIEKLIRGWKNGYPPTMP